MNDPWGAPPWMWTHFWRFARWRRFVRQVDALLYSFWFDRYYEP